MSESVTLKTIHKEYSGAINEDFSLEDQRNRWRLDAIGITTASGISDDLTFYIVTENDSGEYTVLLEKVSGVWSDVYWQPDDPIIFERNEELRAVCANSDSVAIDMRLHVAELY